MKTSKYNYFIPYKGQHIIFNGVSKKFFIVSDRNHKEIKKIISDPVNYKDKFYTFINKIYDGQFVIDDNTNELEEIQKYFYSQRDNNMYKLMILPTYSCNLSCWYCIQEHRNLKLSKHDIDLVKKHIHYYIKHNKDVKTLMLSWFGGEPMIAFDAIVNISLYAKKICKKYKINFNNTITTNGTLLTQDRILKLKDIDMNFFQITLDGIKEDHDKVKSLVNKSSYELILSNIKTLIDLIPQVTCSLRFNYTDQNIKPREFIEGISERIPATLRKNIVLSFKKVWQTDILSIDQEKMDELYKLAKENSYRVDTTENFNICYVERLHYNTIFPNGRVDKCDNIEPQKARGTIMSNGEIKWSEYLPYWEHTCFVENQSECYTCKYLPVCNGPCPIERDNMWFSQQNITCRYNNPKEVCEERIIRFCESFL